MPSASRTCPTYPSRTEVPEALRLLRKLFMLCVSSGSDPDVSSSLMLYWWNLVIPATQYNTIQYNTIHNATQRNATQRNATQRNATQRNATQRNATQRNATQRNATQRNATQRNATQRNATQRNILQFKNSTKSMQHS